MDDDPQGGSPADERIAAEASGYLPRERRDHTLQPHRAGARGLAAVL